MPNSLKSCFLIKLINFLITITLVINATIAEISNNDICHKLNINSVFNIFNKEAPNITGIAKQNVNSTAAGLDIPNNKEPIIVAPDLDVPGNIAAITWNKPIYKAYLNVISFVLLILKLLV